jgi:hypothetical protein
MAHRIEDLPKDAQKMVKGTVGPVPPEEEAAPAKAAPVEGLTAVAQPLAVTETGEPPWAPQPAAETVPAGTPPWAPQAKSAAKKK